MCGSYTRTLASSGSLLEMQKLRSHSRLTELSAEFLKDLQVINMPVKL